MLYEVITVKILEPGLKMLEDLIPVKTVGVVPYLNLKIDDEDSLSDAFSNNNTASEIDIAVIRVITSYSIHYTKLYETKMTQSIFYQRLVVWTLRGLLEYFWAEQSIKFLF